MISIGLESASSAASGVLETISTTFTSTKYAICTAWAEVPTFFSGLFDGLGDVASSAGSAILSGLTFGLWSFYAGEHRAEVVIPLSSSRRARALDLLEKTTVILGGQATSFAGDKLQLEPELDVFSDSFGIERPTEKLKIRRETQEILPNNTIVSTSTPISR